jgi:hypothetical protein
MAQVDEALLPHLGRVMTAVLPTLQKYDIRWAKEIHAPLRPKVLLEFIKEMDNEYLGLTPDFSAWQQKTAQTRDWEFTSDDVKQTVSGYMGESPVELLEDVMPYSYHVHAKAHHFDENGVEPDTPYDKLVTVISKSLFSGYISAEFEGWQLYKIEDSKKIVETHVNLIRKYL